MKYKYKILLALSVALTYGSLTYFSKAGFPIKAFLTMISMLVFLRDEKSCEDSFCLMVPSLSIGYLLSLIFKSINSEWFLFLGFIIYFALVYIYSYTIKVLSKRKSKKIS